MVPGWQAAAFRGESAARDDVDHPPEKSHQPHRRGELAATHIPPSSIAVTMPQFEPLQNDLLLRTARGEPLQHVTPIGHPIC